MPTITTTCQDCRRNPAEPRSTRCADCAAKHKATTARYNSQRMADPVWKLYQCAAWDNFRKVMRANGNIFCQRIEDGIRCERPATVGHHLVSPRDDRSLVYNHNNVVMVCAHHHPREAGDSPDNEYVPTLMTPPGQGIKIPEWYPQPGQQVPRDCPRWHSGNVYVRVKKLPPRKPVQGHTTSVGTDALDKALAGIDDLLKGI